MKAIKGTLGIITLALALGAPAQAQTFLTNGLVAYYPLDGNAVDASGNGNNGVPVNVAFTTDRFGVAGGAAQFSGARGTNSAIDCPTLDHLPFLPASYSCWFLLDSNFVIGVDYPVGGVGYMTLVGREQPDFFGTEGAFGLVSGEVYLHLTNQLVYFGYEASPSSFGNVRPATNAWSHGVLTVATSGLVSLYLNGNLRGTAAGNAGLLGGRPLAVPHRRIELQCGWR